MAAPRVSAQAWVMAAMRARDGPGGGTGTAS